MRNLNLTLAFIFIILCFFLTVPMLNQDETEKQSIEITCQPKEISITNNDIISSEKTCITNNVVKKEKELLLDLTQEELNTFYMLVFAEDGIENEEAQVAVAATIINRVLSNDFSDDFKGVINQSGAFSSVRNGKIYIMTNDPYEATIDMVSESTKRAVQRALEGEDPTEEALKEEARKLGLDEEFYAGDGALYFYNAEACGPEELKARENIQVEVSLGLHSFYKVWG